MSDNRALRIAMLLNAIQAEERSFSEAKTEHKDTMTRLENQLHMLKEEILTGQQQLPIEPAA